MSAATVKNVETLKGIGDDLDVIATLFLAIKRGILGGDDVSELILAAAEKGGALADRCLDNLSQPQVVGDFDAWAKVGEEPSP